ncbi:threonine/homoserine efflux transporter RhtA [Acidovorax sp. 56]|uniref:DMT family transporter n=1 Tax=Acidovorax sp. 56 TaxID=2035205 RepID=UPI000C166046|nr:DMT family transporter [Acidovorax sp. 56]PIF25902.1 threonine/homoserine efflux transporter RhtA [Acidovorax sp. 56]
MPWKHWSAERLGIVLAVLAALGFSFKAIFVKLAYAVPQAVPVDSVTLLALRMAFSVPVFAWVGWRASRALSPLPRRDWLAVIALGLLGYYGSSILDFMGLQYITASLERLILFTYPTLTILIGVLFMGKRASRREVGALLLSYAGIGLAFAHDLHIAGDTRAVLIGAGFVFGSAVSYAFYQAGSEPAIRRLGAARFTALAMLVSTGATLLHFGVSQPVDAFVQPTPVYLHALGMALFSTVLPVFMTSAAIRRIGAAKTALIGTLGPVLTIFFGCWLLDEPLSWPQMAGAALVLAGVLLISKRGASAVSPSPSVAHPSAKPHTTSA